MVRGFHFGFEGCWGGLVVVLSLRREGTYTVSPSEPRLPGRSQPVSENVFMARDSTREAAMVSRNQELGAVVYTVFLHQVFFDEF